MEWSLERYEQLENEAGSGSILEIRFSSDETSMQYKLNTLFGKWGQDLADLAFQIEGNKTQLFILS